MDDKQKRTHDHNGHRARLRERFLREGLSHFEPHEMLELIMQYAIPRRDTNALGHRLLDTFGSLDAVFAADPKELETVPGMGAYSATLIHLVHALFAQVQRASLGERPLLNTFGHAGRYMVPLLHGHAYEAMYCVCVDKQFRLLYPALVGKGTLDEAVIYPRLVVEAALRHRAAGVYLAHNHPGGSLAFSQADLEITRRIEEALLPIGVDLHDHFIVAGNRFTSWRRQGQIGLFDVSGEKTAVYKAAERADGDALRGK